jgi:hypothetical protein
MLDKLADIASPAYQGMRGKMPATTRPMKATAAATAQLWGESKSRVNEVLGLKRDELRADE